ncbi:MAG: hypothetical protein JWQ49_919 [Edaphobacter sp.]|nr:hypothetical protein [Edaphobacter sp.]
MINIENVCRAIYTETGRFYEELQPRMGDLAFGYKIMYGPPVIRPRVLFLGYQPGGAAADDERERANGAHEGWPQGSEYASERWRLAAIMQKMFDRDKLKCCTGLNAIFLRAPSVESWERTRRDLRDTVEAFCLPRVNQIVQALQPVLVVAIGFKALDLFGPSHIDLVNAKGRVITKSGVIAGYPAIGTLHLSGAQISGLDRVRIAERVGLS